MSNPLIWRRRPLFGHSWVAAASEKDRIHKLFFPPTRWVDPDSGLKKWIGKFYFCSTFSARATRTRNFRTSLASLEWFRRSRRWCRASRTWWADSWPQTPPTASACRELCATSFPARSSRPGPSSTRSRGRWFSSRLSLRNEGSSDGSETWLSIFLAGKFLHQNFNQKNSIPADCAASLKSGVSFF